MEIKDNSLVTIDKAGFPCHGIMNEEKPPTDAVARCQRACDTWLPMARLVAVFCALMLVFNIRCFTPSTERMNNMNEIQWGRSTEDLAISISVPEPVCRSGDAIVLSISLKNIGRTPVPIVVRSTWIDYATTVRYEDGTEVPKTEYALQMMEAAQEGRRLTRELMPEEVTTENLELSKAFEMTQPGNYAVVATRATYKRGKLDEYATVTSNELTFKVVPRDNDQ